MNNSNERKIGEEMFQVSIPETLWIEMQDAIQAMSRRQADVFRTIDRSGDDDIYDPARFVLTAVQYALLSLREDNNAVLVGLDED